MVDVVMSELAKRQYGLFSRSQVLAAKGSDDVIKQRLRAKRWMAVAEGVYSFPGMPDSWRRSLMAACLEAGPEAVVSHQSAAALHQMATFAQGPVIAMVAHGDHQRLQLGRLRQSTDLRAHHRTVVEGIAVTTPARTIVDLAAVIRSRERLARVVDDAHASGLCRVGEVSACWEELRRPGKRGLRMLGVILSSRGPGYVPTASVLERRLLRVLRAGGLPEPKRQFPLPWRADAEGRVDFAYPEHKVLIEADGRRWHIRQDQMDNDRRRDRDALNSGWRPYRFMWDEITKRPESVCAAIRDALASVPSK